MLLMLAAMTLVGYGAWLIYPPAGFITAGLECAAAAYMAAQAAQLRGRE